MKYLNVFLVVALIQTQGLGRDCKKIKDDLCGGVMDQKCLTENLDSIPSACLSVVTEQMANSHPCTKQLNKGKKLSKKCEKLFSQQEARAKDFSKNCSAVQKCSGIRDPKKYKECVQKQSEKSEDSCKKVFN